MALCANQTGQSVPMFKPKYRKWLINIVILVMATVLMLAVVEVAMRWLDGYQISTFELQQDPNSVQQVE